MWFRAEQCRGSKGLFLKVGHDQTFLFSSYDNDKPVRDLFKEHEALTGFGVFFNQYASKAGLTRFERFLRQVVFIIWRLWKFFDQIVEQWVTSEFFVECNFCTKVLELKLRMPEIFQLMPAWRWVWHKTSHVFSFELSEIYVQMKCFRCVMF